MTPYTRDVVGRPHTGMWKSGSPQIRPYTISGRMLIGIATSSFSNRLPKLWFHNFIVIPGYSISFSLRLHTVPYIPSVLDSFYLRDSAFHFYVCNCFVMTTGIRMKLFLLRTWWILWFSLQFRHAWSLFLTVHPEIWNGWAFCLSRSSMLGLFK